MEAWDSLVSALRVISESAPSRKGSLQGFPRPLEGLLRKRWVAGHSGYRLVYMELPRQRWILPVLVSSQRRKDFKYDVELITGAATAILKDIRDGNEGHYRTMAIAG